MLDLEQPLEAGIAIAGVTILPVLVAVELELSREDALRLWAGALSSLAGALGAAVGIDAACVLLESLRETLAAAPGHATTKGMH